MRAWLCLWAVGCFNPKFNNPACGPAGECPPGLVCSAGTCQVPNDGDIDVDDAPPDVMIDTPPGSVTRTFQQGVGGYNLVRDTYLDGTNSPNNTELQVRWGKNQNHGLLAFDGIFGSNAIPTSATIISATLTIQISNSAPGNLYEVEVTWPVTVTTDTFGPQPGVDVNDDLADLIATVPNTSGSTSFDVTNSVKRWKPNASLNQGWCFFPVSGDDGAFKSSDDGNMGSRPKLTVVYFP
jgi:hypothetical protein